MRRKESSYFHQYHYSTLLRKRVSRHWVIIMITVENEDFTKLELITASCRETGSYSTTITLAVGSEVKLKCRPHFFRSYGQRAPGAC